jgi:hypothetical protein
MRAPAVFDCEHAASPLFLQGAKRHTEPYESGGRIPSFHGGRPIHEGYYPKALSQSQFFGFVTLKAKR